jgi:hypothetical protein
MSHLSINVLEAEAVLRSLFAFRNDLKGQTSALVVDNTSCEAGVRRGYSGSYHLNKVIAALNAALCSQRTRLVGDNRPTLKTHSSSPIFSQTRSSGLPASAGQGENQGEERACGGELCWYHPHGITSHRVGVANSSNACASSNAADYKEKSLTRVSREQTGRKEEEMCMRIGRMSEKRITL